MAYIGQKRRLEPVALLRPIARGNQVLLDDLMILDALTNSHDPVRSALRPTQVNGFLLEPFPGSVGALQTVGEKIRIQFPGYLGHQRFDQAVPFLGMHPGGKFVGRQRTVSHRNTQMSEPAGVDDHFVLFDIEKPGKNLRIGQRHFQNVFPGQFFLDIPEQEKYPD